MAASSQAAAPLVGGKFIEACRICKGRDLSGFLDLGDQPHCNSFLRANELNSPEPRWPLSLLYCNTCHLVQLDCVVDPSLMFSNYVYVSGTTSTLPEHFRATAREATSRFGLGSSSLVVDIGSNDGTFLSGFQALGLRTLGVDPATNITELANARGITTINDFFGEAVARRIVEEQGSADLITAAGVFFHIDDMDDVCRGIAHLLSERGVLHIQAIYLGAMLEQSSFDNVYHEHVSYYTLHSLKRLLERFGLRIFDVGMSAIHGGSLMVFAGKGNSYAVSNSVEAMLNRERELGYDTLAPYRAFADRVRRLRSELVTLLHGLKAKGMRIAAYGAPAKGNTLLNYCGIGTDLIEYAAERAPLKIGLFTPGMHIPVIDEAEAMKNPPDYFLMLPWNFSEELIAKNRPYRERGGKFIIPVPSPRIV